MTSTTNAHTSSAPARGSGVLSATTVQRPETTMNSSSSAMSSEVGGVLRLRGGPRNRPQVAWEEGVVDNEGCGKKKSKICCIYHKPRPFDESSDESDVSGDESGDEGLHSQRASLSAQSPGHRTDGPGGSREGSSFNDKFGKVDVEHNAYEAQPKGKAKCKS